MTIRYKLYQQHNLDQKRLIVDCIALKLSLIHDQRVDKKLLEKIVVKADPIVLVNKYESIRISAIHSEPLLKMIQDHKEKLFSPLRMAEAI